VRSSGAITRTGAAQPVRAQPVGPTAEGYLGLGAPGAHGPAFSPWTLLRAKWLMLATFLLTCGAAVPYIWLFVHPTYSARAIVRVSPVVSRIVFKTEDNGIVPLYQSYLNTQVSIIKSPQVLERVLDREDVRGTSWLAGTQAPIPGVEPLDPLERLQDTLSVRPRRNTELIDVSIETEKANDAKVLVDAVVDEYKRMLDESARDTNVRRFETLRNEQLGLQREIDALVETKFELSKRLGTTGPEELRLQLSAHLNTLESDLAALQRRLALARWEMRAREADAPLQADGTNDGPVPGEVQTVDRRYSDDPEWRRLNLDLENAQHQLLLARQQYGDAHPRIQQLQSTVEYTTRLVAQREGQLTAQWSDPSFASLSVTNAAVSVNGESGVPLPQQIRRLERQVELLAKEIDDQRKKVAEAGEVAKQIAQFDEEIRYKRELYDTVRSRIAQLELESNAPARVSVAAHAVKPSKATRDRRMLLTVMAVGMALMASLGLGYLRITLDSRIREAGEVRHTVRAPFLGQLPAISPFTNLMTTTDPALMESVRMVRTAMMERVGQIGASVVLVTSSSSRTGKTSLSILLARSLALLGKRTLLVEADLRRPSLAERLQVDRQAGLAALLVGEADDDAAIVPSSVAKLDVLTAGALPATFTAELLANGVLTRCLSRWKEEYDFVVLDSPPVLPVADARILAGQADGTIMVLRSAFCRRNEVMQACADISASGGRLLGAVLVGAAVGTGYGYYGEQESLGAGRLAAVRA